MTDKKNRYLWKLITLMRSLISSLFVLFFLSIHLSAADYFWIGGSGNWSDPNNWSATSGGAAIGSIPTATDNVIFDANSGLTSAAQTVTMDVAFSVVDFDFSGVPSVFTFSSSLPSIEITGSLSSNGLAIFSWGGIINMNSITVGNFILSNGATWTNDVHIIGSESIDFSDNFTSNNDLYVEVGGMTANSVQLTCANFFSNTTNVRSIDFSGSQLNITGNTWDINGANLTLSSISSSIVLNNIGAVNFVGGNQIYDTLRSSASNLSLAGNNSFSLADLFISSQLTLENGATTQLDSLITGGSCGFETILTTVDTALANAFIEKTGHPILTTSNLSISGVDAVINSGQTYSLSLSDTTKAFNWEFEGTSYYWIGNSGNWSDPNHWSLSSGGPVAGCIPNSNDSVYFDANSFSLANQTVTIDQFTAFGYMDWTGSTGNPTLALSDLCFSYGDVIFAPTTTIINNNNGLRFEFKQSANFYPNAANFSSNLSIFTEDDTDVIQQLSDLTMSDSSGLFIFSGGYNSNGNIVQGGVIQVVDLPSMDNKSLDISNSVIELKSGFNSENVTTTFTFAGTGSDLTVGASNRLNFLLTEGLNFGDVTLDFYYSDFTQRVAGNNFYNKFKIEKGSHIVFDSLSIHTISDSLIIQGNCVDSIYLSSTNSLMPAIFSKSTSTDVIAECIDMTSITAGNAALSAIYSTDNGNNGNWTFPAGNPTSSNFTVDGPFCFGDTTFFTNLSTVVTGNQNDVTYYWLFDDGSTGYWNVTSPTDSSFVNYELDTNQHEFIIAGDFDVSLVSEFTNFCKDTMTIAVHINNPNVFMTSSDLDKVICSGDEVTLDASSSTPGTEFEFFLNGTSQNTPSVNDTIYTTSSFIDSDTISVIAYENGCPSDTMPSFVFTVNDLPTFTWLSSDADTAICLNDTVSFVASAIDPTYTYNFLLNGVGQTGYTTNTAYENSTLNDGDTVSVVANSTDGCKDTLSMEFTVHPLPIMTLDDDVVGNVICDGQLVTFTATGASTYEFFVNGVSQGIQVGTSFSTDQLTTGDVVSVVGYSSEGCEGNAPNSFSYTVNPLPNINVNYSPSLTICSGTNVTFNLSGGSTYEYFINDVSQGPVSSTNSYVNSTLANGDYVYFEGGFSGCTNFSDTLVFTVNTSPTTTLVSDDIDQIICAEDLVTFTASGANNYEFFVDGVSQGIASPTSTFQTNGLTNGQTVSVQGESNTCVLSQSLTFSVLPLPSINIFSNDPNNTICEGEPITFTAVNGSQYEFFINGISQGGPTTSNTLSPALLAGNNNVYVIGTAANGCSDTSALSIDVTVNPIPTVLVASSDINDSICDGESVTFTATGSDQFQFFLDGVPQGSMSNTNTYSNDNLTNGQTVTVIGNSLGCQNTSNAISTSVFAYPNLGLVGTDVDNIFCENVNVDYTASGATNYEFFLDGISQGAASGSNLFSTFGLTSGTYLLEVIGESNTCADTNSVSFTINSVPVAGITSSDPNNEICAGDNVNFVGTGGALYQFFVNGVSQGAFSPIDNINLNSLANGDVVSVTVTDASGCTSSATNAAFVVNPTPTVGLTSSATNQEICIGETVNFTASGATNYEFFVNGISQGSPSTSNTYLTVSLADGDVVTVSGESNGCPNTSSGLTFTVHDFPIVNLINNSDTSLCGTELTDLQASGATNYQFFVNGTPVGTFGTNPNFTNSLNDGDIVTVTGSLFGCETTAPQSIQYSVTPTPNLISVINPGTTICADDIVTATVTGGLTYEYTLNGIVQPVIGTFSSTSIETGDVLTITAFNNDCPSIPDSYTFTVNEMNLELTSNPSSLICEGENVTFTASGGDQYQFFVNGVAQGGMSTVNTFSSTSLTDGDVVSFSAFSNGTGCTQQNDAFVIMNVLSEPTISAQSSTTICDGDSVVLLSNATYGNQWTLNGNPIAGANDTSYTATTDGLYGLEVIAGGNGELWSFGNNSYGVFADGTNVGNPDPTPADTGFIFDEIASGERFVLGVDPNGVLYSWGDNEFGQLGDGTFADENAPQVVAAVTDVKTIATAQSSSMALTNSGDVYVWGRNNVGQLATGSTSVINFPFLNTNLTNIDTIAAGRNHYLFLRTDGTVWASGSGAFGQLGNGTMTNALSPVQVSGLTNIVAIGAGEYQSFAIDISGNLFVWGNNGSGQLGLGDLTNRLVPTPLSIPNVIAVGGGANHSLFMTSTAKVYASGGNAFGQLGNGTTTSSTIPVKMELGGAKQISAAQYTSLVLRQDNSVYVCGDNSLDQLSSNSGAIVSTPEVVADLDGVTFIEANPTSSHFIYGNSTSCVSTGVTVTVLSSPSITISVDSNTLTASEVGVSYQWYLNGLPIPAGVNQSYEALVSGNYYVEVTFANGCIGSSTTIYHGMASLKEVDSISILLYPNPANDKVFIQSKNADLSQSELLIFDGLGRKISTIFNIVNNEIILDINSLSNGTYIVVIENNYGRSTTQFVKINKQ